MKRRRFTQDFKRSVVEQLLSETAGPAELCRRYNIASGQLYIWKKQYANGKLDPEPSLNGINSIVIVYNNIGPTFLKKPIAMINPIRVQ
ncbi:MAG: transposase [Desulfobacterales bacterium]|uniref:Transposase n=1 Tax=Candidatus Desulfatibia vada TaxID=2841696 RepID=A0A8J6NV82_9BACT|nr:transposase [Candidatus Desulfatibia vada]MBL6970621.1 transposase [Desulfobacterales bacterium]